MAHLSNCRVYNYSFWFVLLTRRRLPQNAALAPNVKIQIFLAPNAQSKYLENRSISQLEHSSPRTGAHLRWRTGARFSENQSTPKLEKRSTSQLEHGSPRTGAHLRWRTGEHLSEELENISMFSIFSAFSMFSMCSELSPLAPSPAGRLEQFMHPWH